MYDWDIFGIYMGCIWDVRGMRKRMAPIALSLQYGSSQSCSDKLPWQPHPPKELEGNFWHCAGKVKSPTVHQNIYVGPAPGTRHIQPARPRPAAFSGVRNLSIVLQMRLGDVFFPMPPPPPPEVQCWVRLFCCFPGPGARPCSQH
jgi:hypothetical protein